MTAADPLDGPVAPRPETAAPGRGLPPSWRPLALLLVLVLVVGILYFSRSVLIPVAVATLLAFLLSPLVRGLHRLGVHHTLGVILVVALATASLGGVVYVVGVQIASLAEEIPKYRHTIRQRIADLRGASRGGSLEKVQETVKEVVGELQKDDEGARPEPPATVVTKEEPPDLWGLPSIVGRWLEPVATGALVLALVAFMLLRRQELRNRVIRLIGYNRLSVTTRALDDASERISRYLLMLSMVNAIFGAVVGTGLFLIGLPYAFLWGLLAALLRFIPYVGAWLAAGLPTLLALAVFPGWTLPLLVIALFVITEPLIFLVVEPLLYGQTTGVSEVVLLIAVAFWTWLWGPAGLLLATPLTVCVVVLGKYVPHLEFLSVLMGDAPAMEPALAYYQRLLASDEDEASDIAEDYLASHSREDLYEAVLVPALIATGRDRARRALAEDDERFVLSATRRLLDDIGARPEGEAGDGRSAVPPLPAIRVFCCPARGEGDALALAMLRQLLDPGLFEVTIISPGLLSAEMVSAVCDENPPVVCIGSLPPGGLASARYLCKRLRARCPSTRIVVGRWSPPGTVPDGTDVLLAAGADSVVSSLRQARDEIVPLVQVGGTPRRASLAPGVPA
jgi:predicted PurR-regulated permease PerM